MFGTNSDNENGTQQADEQQQQQDQESSQNEHEHHANSENTYVMREASLIQKTGFTPSVIYSGEKESIEEKAWTLLQIISTFVEFDVKAYTVGPLPDYTTPLFINVGKKIVLEVIGIPELRALVVTEAPYPKDGPARWRYFTQLVLGGQDCPKQFTKIC